VSEKGLALLKRILVSPNAEVHDTPGVYGLNAIAPLRVLRGRMGRCPPYGMDVLSRERGVIEP
jgi:hypothetical protein